MNWKDLGRIVLSQAPLLGAALGGPAGLAIKAGAALAKRIGAPDNASPDEIAAILQDTDIGKIGREMEHEIRMFTEESKHEQQMAAEWGKNYRAELSTNSWLARTARPMAIWVVLVETFMLFVVVSWLALSGKAADAATLMASVTPVLGIQQAMAVYIAKKRSDDKHLSAGNQPSSVLGGLLGKLAK